jgi:hypothetical protein
MGGRNSLNGSCEGVCRITLIFNCLLNLLNVAHFTVPFLCFTATSDPSAPTEAAWYCFVAYPKKYLKKYYRFDLHQCR